MKRYLAGLIVFFSFVVSPVSYAEAVDLTVVVKAKDDLVSVTVSNDSRSSVDIYSINIELNGGIYHLANQAQIKAKSEISHEISVAAPQVPGTYPLVTEVVYQQDGLVLSHVDVGYFHHQKENILDVDLAISALTVRKSTPLRMPEVGTRSRWA